MAWVILNQEVKESHSLYIYVYSNCCFLRIFDTDFYDIKYSNQIQIIYSAVWFQVYQLNTNNYMISSNHFYPIKATYLHTVIWF